VAAGGGLAAYGTAALFYVPLLLALYAWKRVSEPSRLPPESLGRAMISGARYVLNAPSIRVVVGRTLVAASAGASVSALLPLVSRDLLGGNAQLFGFLLGAFGLGSVISALNMARLRNRLSNEAAVRLCTLGMALAIIVVAVSRWPVLSGIALVLFGLAWTGCMMILNVTVQISAPRWVAARTLAMYQAGVATGVELGGWCWGILAN
jgi:predicted MFS family arabinose efflux permease